MIEETKKKNSIVGFLEKQFDTWLGGNHPNDQHIEDSPLGATHSDVYANPEAAQANDSTDDRDSLNVDNLPEDRSARYAIFQEMAKDPTLSEGLDIHISHALATDKKTGQALVLKATSEEWEELVDELNQTIVPMINKGITAWAKTMCIYGVNYVRPYAQEKVGITHFETNYYTLPHFTREYERRGALAGFTNQHLRDNEKSGAVTLAPPWSLIPLKVPFFTPNPNIMPKNPDGTLYSLLNDNSFQSIIETQDYGTSFFENSYVPWRDLRDALDSLRASRKNASRIDRLIMPQLGDLDPAQAAEYVYFLAEQLQDAADESARVHAKNQTKPLITNSVLPAMQDKGGMTIDTHATDPNIQHIEDILFHLKRLAASIGVDVSLLGWADTMSGGLGEGGFLQTAIQAARRAAWIRLATENLVNDAAHYHVWYKMKKALPKGQKAPWKVVFNSMNTAIEEQENLDREARANFATIVATLIDTVFQGSTSGSPTLTKLILSDTLDADEETMKTILSELVAEKEKQANVEEDNMFSNLHEGEDEADYIQSLLSRLWELKNND